VAGWARTMLRANYHRMLLSRVSRRVLLRTANVAASGQSFFLRYFHASLTVEQREVKTKPKAKEKVTKSGPPSAGSEGGAAELEGGDDVGGGAKDLASMLGRSVDYARREMAKVRGSVVSASMLDHVLVEAYGEMQPMRDVGQVSLKGAAMLVVNPFDASLAEAVGNAIRDADLGLNPTVEGAVVRVAVPKASKETREAAAKLVSKIAEHAKTRARRARAADLERIKKAALPEDDARRESKVVEEAVAAATAEIAKLADAKRLEIERG
jgi:ribosome recycling factor